MAMLGMGGGREWQTSGEKWRMAAYCGEFEVSTQATIQTLSFFWYIIVSVYISVMPSNQSFSSLATVGRVNWRCDCLRSIFFRSVSLSAVDTSAYSNHRNGFCGNLRFSELLLGIQWSKWAKSQIVCLYVIIHPIWSDSIRQFPRYSAQCTRKYGQFRWAFAFAPIVCRKYCGGITRVHQEKCIKYQATAMSADGKSLCHGEFIVALLQYYTTPTDININLDLSGAKSHLVSHLNFGAQCTQ